MRVLPVVFLLGASVVLSAESQINFAAPKAFEDPTPQQVLKADFNRDGRTDLVTIDIGSVNLYLSQGKGRFHPAQVISKGNGTSAALGDFNGDGKIDIAVLNFSFGGVPEQQNVHYLQRCWVEAARTAYKKKYHHGGIMFWQYLGDPRNTLLDASIRVSASQQGNA